MNHTNVNTNFTSLSDTYADWLHTQNLLEAAKSQLLGLDDSTVHVLLENIIMHRLLHCRQPTVRLLFQGVERPSILAGFEAISTAPTVEWINTIEALFHSSWSTEAEEPKVSLETNILRVGSFVQPLVAPVSRLIDVAMQHYPEDEALYYVARCALRYASIYAKPDTLGPHKLSMTTFIDGESAMKDLLPLSMLGCWAKLRAISTLCSKTPMAFLEATGAFSNTLLRPTVVLGAWTHRSFLKPCAEPWI